VNQDSVHEFQNGSRRTRTMYDLGL
jgi:hypothetical protein